MLRFDDTDVERSKEEFAEQIQQDLTWLGLPWDQMARQSQRMARYEEVKNQLEKAGRLYPCYETEEELEVKRKMLISRGKPPIYDRAALKLTDEQKAEFEAKGIKPHWRFKMKESEVIEWEDEVKGYVKFEAKNLSDPVVIRANGCPTYLLPSAIDDVDFNITHIVRGEDHVTNTAIQIQIFEAIGGKAPKFAHHSLIKSKEGKISKRLGGFDIKSLREEGIEPLAITSFLARLGTSEPIEPRVNMQEIIDNFAISSMSKSSAIYDFAELERINQKIVHMMTYDMVKDRDFMKGIDADFWESVKLNLSKAKDVRDWWKICNEVITPLADDVEFTKVASGLLPDGKWDENTWNVWINAVKEKTGRKGRDLFMPIRKALTAQEHGPELYQLLPLIGNEKAHARLNGKAA